MDSISVTKARTKLIRLIDEVAHAPIMITSNHCNAVLVSENDWNSIQETLCLLSVPGMRESIQDGLATKVEECEKKLDNTSLLNKLQT